MNMTAFQPNTRPPNSHLLRTNESVSSDASDKPDTCSLIYSLTLTGELLGGYFHLQCLTAIGRPPQASAVVSAQPEDGRRYARRLLNELRSQLARQNAESVLLRAVTEKWFNKNAISAESSSNVTQRTDCPRADAHDPQMTSDSRSTSRLCEQARRRRTCFLTSKIWIDHALIHLRDPSFFVLSRSSHEV